MANIKSAQKRMRQAVGRSQRNRGVRTRLKTAVKKFRQTETGKKTEALPRAYAEIDLARKKGVIHKKTAARYKSRLAKKVELRAES